MFIYKNITLINFVKGLIGATSQAANPQTYSHDTVYVDGDGRLEAKNAVVGGTISSLSSYYTEAVNQTVYSNIGSTTIGSSYVSLSSSNFQGGPYLYLQDPEATNRLEGYMYINSSYKYKQVTVPAGKQLQVNDKNKIVYIFLLFY